MSFRVSICKILATCLILTTVAVDAQTRDDEKAFSGTYKELIGLWSGEGEMIEFRADGQCRYRGELYPYSVSQGRLVLKTGERNVIFAFKLVLDQLILTANGLESTYNRVVTSEGGGPRHETGSWVGKWCYMKSSSGEFTERCYTLNADGTYAYNAGAHSTPESGTWYVSNGRFYFQSAVRGSGSYRLENKNLPVNGKVPLIVLDDEPFITVTRRAPW